MNKEELESYIKDMTKKINDVTVYSYSDEDLEKLMKEILKLASDNKLFVERLYMLNRRYYDELNKGGYVSDLATDMFNIINGYINYI